MTSTAKPMTWEEKFEAARLAEEEKRKGAKPSVMEQKLIDAGNAGKPPPLSGNEAMGNALANTIFFGNLDKVAPSGPGFVNGFNEWVSRLTGMTPPPSIPPTTSEEVTEKLKRGEAEQPGASFAGKAAGRGMQALAMAPLLPFTGAAATGAATAGVPSAIQNAFEYGRGKKTGGQALSETAVDTGIGAVAGPIARGVAGLVPKIPGVNALTKLIGGEPGAGVGGTTVLSQQTPRTTFVPPKGGGFMGPAAGPPAPITAIPREPIAAIAERGSPSALAAAGRELVSRNNLTTAMAGAAGSYASGIPAAAAAGLVRPAATFATQAIKNAGTNAASEALALLERNPTLALQLARNPTAFEAVMRALISAPSGGNQVPSAP